MPVDNIKESDWLNGRFDLAVTVYIRRAKGGDKGYISAYSTYPKRDGESWNRGNDLPDGPATPQTVDFISQAVKKLAYKPKKEAA